MENRTPLIILTGPTAVGKTELSVRLAEQINGEIISADSIQIYRHMDIGSAKVTLEEMHGIRHYLIDELEPDEEFNIYIFQEKAKAAIKAIYQAGKIPIIAGGTGFYIQSLLYDIQFTEEKNDMAYRRKLESVAARDGAEILHKMLAAVDEQSARDIHANNVKRVIRALEYYHQTGEKISVHNEEQRQRISPYDFRYFVLNMDRTLLYQRIDKRVDLMIAAGLEDEVRWLLNHGYHTDLVSMQGIGYKEMCDYINGNCTREEAIYTIKRDTRHFAKRQLTWFRREKDVRWVNYEDFGMDKDQILAHLVSECQNLSV